MRINPEQFSDLLLAQHGINAQSFNSLINHLSGYNVQELTTACFNKFIQNFDFHHDSLIFNQIYDLFNYLRLYREGGVFKLFKERQAEWMGPKIRINELDVPPWDPVNLKEPIIVYRGMSKTEYDSGDFGQSWSIRHEVAHRFATETYSDTGPGIVGKAILNIGSVLHFDPQDCEGEVIVKDGSVFNVEII